MKVCSLAEPSVWLANGYPSEVRQLRLASSSGVSTFAYDLLFFACSGKKELPIGESNPGRERDRLECYQLHQTGLSSIPPTQVLPRKSKMVFEVGFEPTPPKRLVP